MLEEHPEGEVQAGCRAAFRAHANRCVACRRRAASEAQLVDLERAALRTPGGVELPEGLVQAILAARQAANAAPGLCPK